MASQEASSLPAKKADVWDSGMGSEQSPKDAPTPAAPTPAATTKAAPKAEPKAQAQPAKSSEAKAEVRASLFCSGSALKPRITQQVQKYKCFSESE